MSDSNAPDLFAESATAPALTDPAEERLECDCGSRPGAYCPECASRDERCACGLRDLDDCECCPACCHACRSVVALEALPLGYFSLSATAEERETARAGSVAYIAELLVGDPLDVEPSPREYRAHAIDACYRRTHARRYAQIAIARARVAA